MLSKAPKIIKLKAQGLTEANIPNVDGGIKARSGSGGIHEALLSR